MAVSTTWVSDALCARTEVDGLFSSAAEQRSACSVCARCPVRLDCLAYAMASGDEYGIWGGLTARERRAVRRATTVDDWEAWLLRSEDPLAVVLRQPAGRGSVLAAARERAGPAGHRLAGTAEVAGH